MAGFDLTTEVAWLTLFRRGNLYMTKPVQIILRSENARRPEVVIKAFLYATGKRGNVIESLYAEIQCGANIYTFASWSQPQGSELVAATGLRIGEDGVTSENHFFETDKGERFYFVKGIYEIRVFAAIVNRSSPRWAKIQRLRYIHRIPAVYSWVIPAGGQFYGLMGIHLRELQQAVRTIRYRRHSGKLFLSTKA